MRGGIGASVELGKVDCAPNLRREITTQPRLRLVVAQREREFLIGGVGLLAQLGDEFQCRVGIALERGGDFQRCLGGDGYFGG